MIKQQEPGMSLIVQTATRLSVGFVLLYGINIFIKGHDSPGGGFVGGVIIALTFINIMLAYGKKASLKKLPKPVSSFFSTRGVLLLFSLVLLSFVVGYLVLNFISKGDPFSLYNGRMISFSQIEIALKAGTGVFAIFSVVLLLRYKQKDDAGRREHLRPRRRHSSRPSLRLRDGQAAKADRSCVLRKIAKPPALLRLIPV